MARSYVTITEEDVAEIVRQLGGAGTAAAEKLRQRLDADSREAGVEESLARMRERAALKPRHKRFGG